MITQGVVLLLLTFCISEREEGIEVGRRVGQRKMLGPGVIFSLVLIVDVMFCCCFCITYVLTMLAVWAST